MTALTTLTTPVASVPTTQRPLAAAAPKLAANAIRRAGLALTAGSLVWASTTLAVGLDPSDTAGKRITDLGGLAFQLGLLPLLAVFLHTRAAGSSRAAVRMIKIERVLLAVAILWSVLHSISAHMVDSTPLAILDAFWPLSMTGMFVLGVKVFFTRRWSGSLRWAPLIAESWLPVTAVGIGLGAGRYIGAAWLLVGYARLGVLLARRRTQVEALMVD
jgi:hypothetical protein